MSDPCNRTRDANTPPVRLLPVSDRLKRRSISLCCSMAAILLEIRRHLWKEPVSPKDKKTGAILRKVAVLGRCFDLLTRNCGPRLSP